MTHRLRSRRWLGAETLAAAALSVAVAGCVGLAPSEAPAPASTVPPDWVAVRTDGGDVQLLLPRWLEPFDTLNAIFANERPAPGGSIAVQLMASGPGSEQPPASLDVVTWIDVRLRDIGSGIPMVTRIALPAGPAVRYERIDRAGTPDEWHLLVYAIKTPTGYAYLQMDGSPDGWRRRASEFESIAMLLRAR